MNLSRAGGRCCVRLLNRDDFVLSRIRREGYLRPYLRLNLKLLGEPFFQFSAAGFTHGYKLDSNETVSLPSNSAVRLYRYAFILQRETQLNVSIHGTINPAKA